ncbi:MAG: hypothetical protein LBD71_01000 [Treponema sp.]|nr:hypothetical protein [Treponema sp.]
MIIIVIVCILYETEENMPLLQVRDFPEDIYGEITFEAHRQNRTIAQQTIVLIKKGLGEEMPNKERRKLAIESTFSRNIPRDAKIADYVKFVREDRER